jgi:hypothetical protein
VAKLKVPIFQPLLLPSHTLPSLLLWELCVRMLVGEEEDPGVWHHICKVFVPARLLL